MKNFKGLITKLEFKSLLYIKGITKSSIIDIIRMNDYISYTYKNVNNNITKGDVLISELHQCSTEHYKTLLN